MYVPMSYKVYPKKVEGNGAVTVVNEASLEDSVSFDHYNIADLNFPKCKLLQTQNMSILEHITGPKM